MRTGGRVQADGGGGREVEALGSPVDGDPDHPVGQRQDVLGQAPRLVAEQPRRRSAEQAVVLRAVQVGGAGAIGGQDGHSLVP